MGKRLRDYQIDLEKELKPVKSKNKKTKKFKDPDSKKYK